MGMARRIGAVPVVPELGARAPRALPAGRREPRSTAFRAARLLETAALPGRERYGALMEVFREAARRPLHAEPHRGDRCSATRFDSPRRSACAWSRRPAAARREGVPSRRPAREGRPGLDGDVARAPVAASRPRGARARHLAPRLASSGGSRGKVALRRAFADLIPAELALTREDRLRRSARRLVPWPPARAGRRHAPRRTRPGPESSCAERGQAPARRALRGERDHGHRLWCLLVLELWQRVARRRQRVAGSRRPDG